VGRRATRAHHHHLGALKTPPPGRRGMVQWNRLRLLWEAMACGYGRVACCACAARLPGHQMDISGLDKRTAPIKRRWLGGTPWAFPVALWSCYKSKAKSHRRPLSPLVSPLSDSKFACCLLLRGPNSRRTTRTSCAIRGARGRIIGPRSRPLGPVMSWVGLLL
jgi:hypothetical protein